MTIKIIGTSHIAIQSVKEVKEAVIDFQPDIIAVELDMPRYHALLSGKREGFSWKDIKYIGIKGFLFALIGAYVEKKLGEKVNVKPGADMISAIKIAKKMIWRMIPLLRPSNRLVGMILNNVSMGFACSANPETRASSLL